MVIDPTELARAQQATAKIWMDLTGGKQHTSAVLLSGMADEWQLELGHDPVAMIDRFYTLVRNRPDDEG
jgi:hypothetical protein